MHCKHILQLKKVSLDRIPTIATSLPMSLPRYGSDRSARIGAMNPDVKSEVEWVDVECWWSVWASRLSARTAKDPGETQYASNCLFVWLGSKDKFCMAGILRQRQVKLQAEPDRSTGVTIFAVEIMEPVSFAQISHNQKFPGCARNARWCGCFGLRM